MARKAGSRYPRRRPLFGISLAAAVLVGIQLVAAPASGQATTSPGPATASHIRPIGNLDCNGYSPVQRPVKPGGMICAEVHGIGEYGHLEDNGHYIGHDEPTVQFYSNRPGSSSNVTWEIGRASCRERV